LVLLLVAQAAVVAVGPVRSVPAAVLGQSAVPAAVPELPAAQHSLFEMLVPRLLQTPLNPLNSQILRLIS